MQVMTRTYSVVGRVAISATGLLCVTILVILYLRPDYEAMGAHHDNHGNIATSGNTDILSADVNKGRTDEVLGGSFGFGGLSVPGDSGTLWAPQPPMDDESLLYKVDVQSEIERSIRGDPFHPLENYRNPCWLAQSPPWQQYVSNVRLGRKGLKTIKAELGEDIDRQDRLHCLPYAMLVGVSKSGTTDLFKRLVRHPDVRRPVAKEIRFWNRQRLGRLRLAHPAVQTMSFLDYLQAFDGAAAQINRSLEIVNGHFYHRAITIEGTPHYLWDYEGWEQIPGNKGLTEPRFTLAHSLRRLLPDLRVMVILRQPTERLYSQFRMLSPVSPPGVFHDLVQRSLILWRRCRDQRTVRSCAYDATLLPWEYSHPGGLTLRAGLYSVFLRDWLSVFPREQVLILKGEEYYSDIAGTLRDVISFLRLRDVTKTGVLDGMFATNGKIANSKVDRHRSLEPMWNTTRGILDEFYQPFVEDLASLLQDKRFLWTS